MVVRLAGTLVADGVAAQIDCAFDLPPRQGLDVIGSDGSLYLATPWRVHEPGIDLRRGRDRERFAIEQTNDYRLQSDNFSRAVRGLEEPLLGRADAFGQAHAIDALYRSAEAGGEAAEVAVAELPSAVSP